MTEREVWYRYDGYEYVSCDEYRVRRHTERGVWLEMGYGLKDKFVLNDARKRFAYPTKEQALESYRMRKLRQIEHCERMIKQCRKGLNRVSPDLSERQKEGIRRFFDPDAEFFI